VLFLATVARAEIVVNPSTTGMYSEATQSRVYSNNTAALGDLGFDLVGTDRITAAVRTFHAYLIYDLHNLTSPITALELNFNISKILSGGFGGTSGFFSVSFGSIPYDPATIAAYHAEGSPDAQPIFESIATGYYGLGGTLPSLGGMIEVLSPLAVADAEAARISTGYFAIGFVSNSQSQQFLAGFISAQLVVDPVLPEPSSLALLGTGLLTAMGAATAGYAKRRRKIGVENENARA
jgi:hypothetical protein